MTSIVESILHENFTDGIYYSHVSVIKPEGKYLFDRQTREKFWKEYSELVYNGKYLYGIAEKPQQYIPVIVDIDLKIDYANYNEGKLYSLDNVKTVIGIYQNILKSIVEDCESINLICILLEKDPYKITAGTKSYIKNGFHLHFPSLFLDKADQEVQLISRVKEQLKERNTFENLGYENSGDVVDKNSCSVPWLLYGSKKAVDSQPYLFSKVYDENLNEVILEECFKHYIIYDKHDKIIPIKGKVEFYLPRILSIDPYGRDTKELKKGVCPPIKSIQKKKEQKIYDKLTVEANLKIAEKLLPMLASFRSEQYTEWMTVGWVLFNISEGTERGLDLWLQFSQRSDNYDEARCLYEWERMTKSDMTIGTLKYYANIDNSERYKEFKRETSDKLIQDSLQGSHNDIARILYTEYENEFVCSSISGKVWYQFVGHRWEIVDEGVTLREKLSSVVVHMVREQTKKFAGEDDESVMTNTVNLKYSLKLISNLKTASFKDSVMKEAREIFYDKRFKDKLDNNPYLIGFKNGIFDLKTDIFRPGRPEDFISKSMPISYKQFSDDDEKVLDVYNFLEKVFPDKSVRSYFLDISSEIFMGGNFRKIVPMWTGEGENGKSVTQMFFEQMLGSSLSIKIPTTLITSKKPLSGSAWPELARAGGGVRAAWLEEFDESESIYCGIFKHLTGNDSFVARDLFEKGRDIKEIKPMFKMFVICNKLPSFYGGGDKATWNRVRVIPFESTFCKEDNPAPESYDEQLRQKRFPMDRDFSKKIPSLVEAFAWILLQHRSKPKLMIDPEKVRIATSAYRQQNDVYRQFIDECIKECPSSMISLSELYSQIKDWFKESMPGGRLPGKNDVKAYFMKIWGDYNIGCKWKGYKIRSLEEDIANGDAIIFNTNSLL